MSPIYTYFCETCKHSTDEMFSMKHRPDAINCKNCNSVSRYQIAPSNFTVNGANAANRYSGDSNYKWFDGGSED